MNILAHGIIIGYMSILLLLSLYGLHRYFILYLYFRHGPKANRSPKPILPDSLPRVTIQLPLYNEQYVADRIISAAAAISYPPELLTIQVLDDSTDETCEIAKSLVDSLRFSGIHIDYIHRQTRTGFKASALQEGLLRTDDELIAVFDADFIPSPDFLKETVSWFTDPTIDMVQARWGYYNRNYSLLTRVQAILLDGHFVLEHAARFYSGRFFNFNGTAGVWRRSAILKAGGWQGDTLTEDLDLSYRAQMGGSRFVFLPDVVCMSELPADITSFKRQQFRWAKGAAQVARKILPGMWRSSLPLAIKLEATVHLTSNFCHLLMVLLTFLLPFSIILRTWTLHWTLGWLELSVFVFTVVSISIFYTVSQRELYSDWLKKITVLPILFSLGIGMCLNNARAVGEAITRKDSPFERTPKFRLEKRTDNWKNKNYLVKKTSLFNGEWMFLLYLATFLVPIIDRQLWLSIPLFVLFLSGYALVWGLTYQTYQHAREPDQGT